MESWLSADAIWDKEQKWVRNMAIKVNEWGDILAITPCKELDPVSIKRYRGVIIPGFINTHCHLELSHMKSVLPTGTGLLPFIKGVVTQREASTERKQEAMTQADQQMRRNGIVAVGDISNVTDSHSIKAKSKIRYHTFIEAFDFMQPKEAEKTFVKAEQLSNAWELTGTNRKSIVPHAPYSVSPELLHLIRDKKQENCSISIHNQETIHENLLFQEKGGDFIPFFSSFGFDFSDMKATGKSSLHHLISHFSHKGPILLVHNTSTSKEDIQAANEWHKEIYWVSCPNANLYIENKLPSYQYFIEEGATMALGTDSLASNWQLSILDEMKVIKRYQSQISTANLIQWATINGARALGFEDTLGTIETGKRPGLILLDLKEEDQWEINWDTSFVILR